MGPFDAGWSPCLQQSSTKCTVGLVGYALQDASGFVFLPGRRHVQPGNTSSRASPAVGPSIHQLHVIFGQNLADCDRWRGQWHAEPFRIFGWERASITRFEEIAHHHQATSKGNLWHNEEKQRRDKETPRQSNGKRCGAFSFIGSAHQPKQGSSRRVVSVDQGARRYPRPADKCRPQPRAAQRSPGRPAPNSASARSG